jgi:hypothetical protein
MVTALADMFIQPAGMLALTTLAANRARVDGIAEAGEGDRAAGAWLRLGGLFAVLGWPALAETGNLGSSPATSFSAGKTSNPAASLRMGWSPPPGAWTSIIPRRNT